MLWPNFAPALTHCIANFYLIPIGMLVGAQIDLQDFFSNIAVVTAGNTLGGIMVAFAYSCIYVRSAPGVDKYTKQNQPDFLVSNPMCFAVGCGIGVVSAAVLAYELGGFWIT